jgi:hypothetical protein
MRKIIASFVLLAATLTGVAVAQTHSVFTWASDFNKWSVVGQAPNTYTFTSPLMCQFPNPYTASTFGFNTNAALYIRDAVTANSEIVAVSTVSTSPCGFVPTSLAHNHYTFEVKSGTAGLQEALNSVSKTSSYPADVIIDQTFYTNAVSIGTTAATLIAAATGGVGINLVDITTSPFTWYSWSGSAYVASSVPSSSFANGGNGSSWTFFKTTELVTLDHTTNAYTDSTANLLPANSIIDMVQGVVNTTIAGSSCASWEFGDPTTAGRFHAADSTLTAGEAVNGPVALTTGVASATTGIWQASAAKVRITVASCGSTHVDSGKVRIVVYGRTFAPPTS